MPLPPSSPMLCQDRLRLRVVAKRQETRTITSFELRNPDGAALPRFEAGAHVLVDIADGLTRQYSLCNDPAEIDRYVIAVLREAKGRGGSRLLCDDVKPGDKLAVSPPRNNFCLREDARASLLIAGGIGITPILGMCRRLVRIGAEWWMHYCTRSAADTAFLELLKAPPFTERVVLHHDGGDPKRGLDVVKLLSRPPPGAHLYCCGPSGLMRAAEDAAAHWPLGTVHFERFALDGIDTGTDADRVQPDGKNDRAFEVEIASTGQVFTVPPGRSILTVLREHGVFVESLCETGICGTCVTAVLGGVPNHRDQVLDEAQKNANRSIALCCSRAKSERLVLDL